jgi:LacI family transcriptional regulator
MTDVAREAGCSQATVSFVLNRNDSIKISPQMRERVFAAARLLGYSASPSPIVASEIEFGTGEMIGFAVDQLSTSPEAIVAIEGARQAAWAAGNVILVAQTQSDPKMEPKTLRALTGKDVAALIYMTIRQPTSTSSTSRWYCSTATASITPSLPWCRARSPAGSRRRSILSARAM